MLGDSPEWIAPNEQERHTLPSRFLFQLDAQADGCRVARSGAHSNTVRP